MSSQRAEVAIPSHGERLAAYFYRPVGRAPVPCVVMAPVL
jgi:dienelactone hydrolase